VRRLAARLLSLTAAFGLALAPHSGANAARQAPNTSEAGFVRLPGEVEPLLEGPFASAPPAAKADAWAAFSQRHGGWDALWQGWTATPKRALGRAITVSGPVADAKSAHAIALDFLRSEAPVTKAAAGIELAERSTVKARRVWYAHFKQLYEGIEILRSNTTVHLDQSGKVMAFGSEIRDDIELSTQAFVTAENARGRALYNLDYDANTDVVSGGEDLYVLPVESAEGTDYHLVRHVHVSQANPPHEWDVFVDAQDAEIRWRRDRVRYGSVSGDVNVEIKANVPSDPVIATTLADIYVTFGGTTVMSDGAGAFAINGVNGVGTLSSLVAGPWARVYRQDGPASGSFSAGGVDADTDPTVNVNLIGGAHPTETTGFLHTKTVHDYVKSLDPALTAVDFQMPVNVNLTTDACNAFWNGASINFYRFSAPDGCSNTIYLADVVYHEYGHGVNDRMYQQLGSVFGMSNGALHEGTADVLANMLEDDPEIGEEFYTTTTVGIRNSDNTKKYPNDVVGEVHADGEIIAGAFWDLRLQVGNATAANLFHFARYGLPDGGTVRLAFQSYFIETLIADDDNGNLADGTPHWNEIIDAFNQHGIGPSVFVDIVHTPLADVDDGTVAIDVDALIQSSSALFPLDGASNQLRYNIDGGGDQLLGMSSIGGDDFRATIPAPGNNHIVEYQIEASAEEGAAIVEPESAPGIRHSFLVGETTQLVENTMEIDEGWTVGDVDDDAVTGIWTRVEPFGTNLGGQPVQPQTDHTPFPGDQCFVTGNAHGGDPTNVGGDDVDGGKTTLFSPVFDASTANMPLIRYFRWYTNDCCAAPGLDVWQVDISNDGGNNWVAVESTMESRTAWTKVMFFVEDFVTPTNDMQLRFIATDAGDGSVVEAAVDDVELLSFVDEGTPVEDRPGAVPIRSTLAQNAPNPFNPATEIHFELSRPGATQLRVYDLSGRLVTTLLDRQMPAGSHSARWTGRDSAGRVVSSGVYLYRIESGDFVQTRRMVLLK